MTKSTITREESIQAVFDLKVGYTLGLADIEILKRVARMALASMDGEPVEVKGSDELYDVIDDDDNVVLSAVSYNEAQTESDGYNGENLYIVRHEAQPAPVVPDGLRLALSNAGIAAPESDEMLAATCEKHIQALVTWVKDRKPFQSAPVVPTFDEWLEISGNKPLGWVKDAMRESYDACRADMLAAAPHDTPALNSVQSVVTAQGKWIPVSEQKPDCWCRTCRPVVLNDMRFVVCPDCGNKRCPRANDHRNACTGSNEPGQGGSAYPDTPREVKP